MVFSVQYCTQTMRENNLILHLKTNGTYLYWGHYSVYISCQNCLGVKKSYTEMIDNKDEFGPNKHFLFPLLWIKWGLV
jgi:hypothetical protein